jgi:hypothetical protein
MTYFEDLSDYTFLRGEGERSGTKNIGWLAKGKTFETAVPKEEFIDLLWKYCKVMVVPTRGFHICELCPPDPDRFKGTHVERRGEKLFLGTAEIRVFAKNGEIYAAPNLIYHYVYAHHYQPPAPFMTAILNVPGPPHQKYFERLRELDLNYNATSFPPEVPRFIRWLRWVFLIKE